MLNRNQTKADYPAENCLQTLFEQQVARTPEAVALVFEEQALSYAELNRRANQLAHYLRRLGVGTEACVGLFLERCPEMVISLLGVLKAGGAYVPLDARWPRQRLNYVIEDAGLVATITCEPMRQWLPENGLSFAKTRSPLVSTTWEMGCNVVELGYMRPRRGILESDDILAKDRLILAPAYECMILR